MERPKLGFLYMLSIPLAAGLGSVPDLRVAGFSCGGWLWVVLLVAGIFVVLTEKALNPESPILFPCEPWLLWVGFVGLSLIWCRGVQRENLQDAAQLAMPVLVGIAGSLFVRSQSQLKLLMRMFVCTLLLIGVAIARREFCLSPAAEDTTTLRPASLTLALAACVFIAGCPPRFALPLLGWAVCLAMVTVTGSRMAAAALLLVPALHPLFRGVLWRGVAILALAGVAVALFYTPVFQERFFHSGSGTLGDLFQGEFVDTGRFDVWPLIFEEAMHHPILGAGVGTAQHFVSTVWPDMFHPHNDYLRVGYELGAIGLVILAGVLLWQIVDLRIRISRSRGAVRRALAASMLGLFVLIITCFTDNTLIYNLAFTSPLFAVMGAAYGVAGRIEATGGDQYPAQAPREIP